MVERTDEYLQFVHFTVKRDGFNPIVVIIIINDRAVRAEGDERTCAPSNYFDGYVIDRQIEHQTDQSSTSQFIGSTVRSGVSAKLFRRSAPCVEHEGNTRQQVFSFVRALKRVDTRRLIMKIDDDERRDVVGRERETTRHQRNRSNHL